eukprot:gb/GFBE01076466.1/.p1 GENE.gb/GFBE01076466.1/~~gb/GFBE01076466.1/.p1  ORF type:complete len:499 (+),score=79.03 gb/GFBE01076466.1/:1-1497(+)
MGDRAGAGARSLQTGRESTAGSCAVSSFDVEGEPTRTNGARNSSFVNMAANAVVTNVNGLTGQQCGTVREGLSLQEGVTTMVINCVGAGVVLLPKVMADVGVIMASMLCVLCALVCKECGVMIGNACAMAEKMEGKPVNSYEDVARVIGGPNWNRILVLTKNSAMLGFLIVYMQFVVDSVSQFYPGDAEEKPVKAIRFVIVFPTFAALAMCTDLKQLANFSSLGVLSVVVQCGSIMIGGLWMMDEIPSCAAVEESPSGTCRHYTMLPSLPPDKQAGACGKYLSVFLFCFAILTTVPSVRSQLAEPSQMHSLLSRSFSIIVLIYFGVMFMGYLGFGTTAPENIVTGISEQFPGVGKSIAVAIILNQLVSAPLVIFCVLSVFESSGSSAIHRTMSSPNIVLRISLIFVLNIIGAALPYLTEVIGLVSSVFGCCNNILFPATFHFLGRRQIGEEAQNPKWRQAKYISSLIVGICVLIFGVQGSLQTLRMKMAEQSGDGAVA